MHRFVLVGVGGFALVTAAYMGLAAQHWYATLPGVRDTGPLNLHFVTDIALAFLSSGLALLWGGARSDATAALCGASWLVLHALFHLWIWGHRGFPADLVALLNLLGIQVPAVLALWAGMRLTVAEDAR